MKYDHYNINSFDIYYHLFEDARQFDLKSIHQLHKFPAPMDDLSLSLYYRVLKSATVYSQFSGTYTWSLKCITDKTLKLY